MIIKDDKIHLNDKEKLNPKKITGTRLASILGLNPYSTPFQTWCEMTKTYEEPFVETIYTNAGKIIEPKQAEYIRNNYSQNIVYPKQIFGENYFGKTKGNFFKDRVFGGMWDYLDIDNNITKCVYEMKTAGSSKKEEWDGERIPEYYALQAALYAWLLQVDDVVIVTTFLNQANGDYINPTAFNVTSENTIIKTFKVSERYPNFVETVIRPAIKWWEDYIEAGISPERETIKDDSIFSEVCEKIKINSKENCMAVSENKVCDNSLEALMDEIIKNVVDNSDFSSETLKGYCIKLSIEIFREASKSPLDDTRLLYAQDVLTIINNLRVDSERKGCGNIYS